MSGYEFMEWMTYYRHEPFDGDYKAAGIVSSVIANVNRDPAKRRDPFTPKDFMPSIERPIKKQNITESIYSFYRAFTGK